MKKRVFIIFLSLTFFFSGCSRYYNPTSPWIAKERYIANYTGMGCAGVDNKIYLFGGYRVPYTKSESEGELFAFLFFLFFVMFFTPEGGGPSPKEIALPKSEVGCYNPENEGYSITSDLREPICYFGCVALDSSIYIIGGTYIEKRESEDDTLYPISRVHKFLPQTNTWTSKSSMNFSRTGAGYVALDGKIWAVGGIGEGGEVLSSIEVYDPDTDSWKLKSTMPTPRYGLTCSAVDGKIYAIGGLQDSISLNKVERYNPVSDEWSGVSNLPEPSSEISSASVNGKIYVFGCGESHSKVFGYAPSNDAWEYEGKMLSPRRNTTSILIEDGIYIIGGYPDVDWEELYSDPYSIELFKIR